jgi:hypothetical protein
MSLFAVNGKEPVAAWIPSLDTAGNGTTTLTDLVSSNNGTLTNMDPATAWVSDTGAGGVRALDFDGTNDYTATALPVSAYPYTFAGWARTRATSNQAIYNLGGSSTFNYAGVGVNNRQVFVYINGSNAGNVNVFDPSQQTLNVWFQFVAVFASATSRILYVNGSSVATNSTSRTPVSLVSSTIGAFNPPPVSNFNGRLDDIRIFNQALNASDVSYLYNSGNGRGRLANNSTFQMGNPI